MRQLLLRSSLNPGVHYFLKENHNSNPRLLRYATELLKKHKAFFISEHIGLNTGVHFLFFS